MGILKKLETFERWEIWLLVFFCVIGFWYFFDSSVTSHALPEKKIAEAISKGQILIGMTKEQAIRAGASSCSGKSVTDNAFGRVEIWSCYKDGVVFINGEVTDVTHLD